MRPRIKGKLERKISEYDSTDPCQSCGKKMLKGQEIEILVYTGGGGSNTKAHHSGACMDIFLAWLNTAEECSEERLDGDPHGDCAVEKSIEERDPMWRRITER